MLKPKERQVN